MPDKYFYCDDYGRRKGHFQQISLLDIAAYEPGLTKNDICTYLKLTSFDCALPMWWVEDVAKVTGIYPAPYFVWDYSKDNYDQPLAIRREGETILRIYNYIKKQENENGKS